MPLFSTCHVLPLPTRSGGGVHFIPKKGKGLQCCEAYFACKGQFVGINTAQLECDLACEVIQKMCDEGKSRSWNQDKHCAKGYINRSMSSTNGPW